MVIVVMSLLRVVDGGDFCRSWMIVKMVVRLIEIFRERMSGFGVIVNRMMNVRFGSMDLRMLC